MKFGVKLRKEDPKKDVLLPKGKFLEKKKKEILKGIFFFLSQGMFLPSPQKKKIFFFSSSGCSVKIVALL